MPAERDTRDGRRHHRATIEKRSKLVEEACAKGGQPAAREAMNQFAKEKHIKSCTKCHSRLAPRYDLKPGALEEFRKLGGQ